jgi:membrane-bound ClpP family serine protease
VPNWNELLQELQRAGSAHDVIRRRYLRELEQLTGRNTIVYYSAWLQKARFYDEDPEPFMVNDQDMNGFMSTIHGLNRRKGLDLMLHTPGGDVAATEALVTYLRAMFDTDIRAIVPQLAMSAGTMIACACREIVMGLHSSLGPVDPQMWGGLSAHGIIEEFRTARDDIRADKNAIYLWQPIISRYDPTLIGEAQKAIQMAEDMVRQWLMTGMFAGARNPGPRARANRVLGDLASHAQTLTHARHIDFHHADSLGLNVTPLEGDKALQDAVLTVHHLCMQTLSDTAVMKLIENHEGVLFAQSMQIQALAVQAPRAPSARPTNPTGREQPS